MSSVVVRFQAVVNTTQEVDNSDTHQISINLVKMSGQRRRSISLSINGKRLNILIDSGSDLTIVNVRTAKRLGLRFNPSTFPVPKIVGANGIPINMIGFIPNACIKTAQGFLTDSVWVATNLTSDSIFGQSSLSAFGALTIRYGGELPDLTVNQITSDFKSSFTTHKPVQCFAHFDSSQPPIRAASRRHSASDHSFIRQKTQRLLREGKIRPSRSSWRNQAFVVREANKKPRMVVDYSQTFNRITPLDAYPIPLVPDLLDRVSQFKIFSYIDLKSAFHQFLLDPEESHLTAFEADNRLYEFVCVPFGLTNSPAAFNRALHDIIGDLPGIVIYMDDVVVGGRNLQEHNTNLRNLFRRASEANLTFSTEKCIFGGTSLGFLGHLITNGTMSPDPRRSAPFLNFPVPTTIKQLERLVGLAVYHAKWVKHFSKVMDPLFYALTLKSLPLSADALEAIRLVKKSIHEAVLHVVDPNKPLSLSLTPLSLLSEQSCHKKDNQLQLCPSACLLLSSGGLLQS